MHRVLGWRAPGGTTLVVSPNQLIVQASAADKDNFFTRKIAENASRPEGLPPSQGAWVPSGLQFGLG